MNSEDYVNLNQAMLLKELGFNFLTSKYYFNEQFINNKDGEANWNGGYEEDEASIGYAGRCCSAPTLAQAQKWLHEEHGLWIIALMTGENKFVIDITDKYVEPVYQSIETFETPFIALSEGINKAIELLKEENNG